MAFQMPSVGRAEPTSPSDPRIFDRRHATESCIYGSGGGAIRRLSDKSPPAMLVRPRAASSWVHAEKLFSDGRDTTSLQGYLTKRSFLKLLLVDRFFWGIHII
jgi:hypothetical protein